MQQSEVQARFLKNLNSLYPRLAFRGMRRLISKDLGPFRFVLRVMLGKRGGEVDLLCMVLSEGFPQEVSRALQTLREAPAGDVEADALPVLVAPYLSEESRTLCQTAGVGYFDLAGNAGLDSPHVFMEISGKPNPEARRKEVQSPYDGKAERVVRSLLFDPSKRWTMRELASAAQVSLGLASMTTTALASEGLLSKDSNGLNLVKPAVLLDQWSERYDLRRSELSIYRGWASVSELEIRIMDQGTAFAEQAALTLWSGAHHLLGTELLTPRLSLYWADDPAKLVRALRLNETRGPSYVFIFQPYDTGVMEKRSMASHRPPVVHPLQLYLDLAAGDEEELALAKRVRERFLAW